MIEAKELRIGNIVYNFLKQPITVTWGNIKWAKDVYPIPLTSETLLNNGFIEDSEPIFDLLYYRLNDFEITDDLKLSGQEMTPLKYVHQLQNLYYSLYQKELEIKL